MNNPNFTLVEQITINYMKNMDENIAIIAFWVKFWSILSILIAIICVFAALAHEKSFEYKTNMIEYKTNMISTRPVMKYQSSPEDIYEMGASPSSPR